MIYPNICVECGKPIEPGETVVLGRNGQMHHRCYKRGKSQGREVSDVDQEHIDRGRFEGDY